MKQVLKNEMERAFSSRGMLLSLAIGGALAVYHCITEVLPMAEDIAQRLSPEMLQAAKGPFYPDMLYYTWLGGTEFQTMPSTLFYMILPILAVLPFADSLFADTKGGYIKNVCLRTDRKNYFRAKYTAVFCSGGVAIALPLLLSFMLAAMFLPAMCPEINSGSQCTIRESSSFPWLYYNLPLLYIALYLVLNFVFSGLLACMSLAATAYVGYRFVVLIVPFIVYLFTNSIFGLLGLQNWQPGKFLLSGFSADAKVPMAVCLLLLLAVTLCSCHGAKKRDIY